VDAAAKARAPVIIALGATEGHGLHLPLGTDTYQGLDMCRRAAAVLNAESIDLVVGPAIPFGPPPFLSESPRGFPGTIAVSNNTLRALTEDVCRSLIDAGFRRLYLLLANVESEYAMHIVAKELTEVTDANITPDHILASGSLPPGFPWTTINGEHYWDGGLVSNSPLDQVVEVGGLTGKDVYIVNLWLDKRALPQSIPEVLARRDEILFAEKFRRSVRSWEYIDGYRQLVEEVMARLEPNVAEQIRRRPRYIETVGEACPLSITRIIREAVQGEPVSRDYEFSRKSIDQHIAQGYEVTIKILQGRKRT
jgi:Creatinine amidohydrolase/Patatin phospholipase/Patatin-like phospholipase